jgi:hypothetical protein
MTPESDDPSPESARSAQYFRGGIGELFAFLAAAARAVISLLGGRLPAPRAILRTRPHPVEKSAPFPVND